VKVFVEHQKGKRDLKGDYSIKYNYKNILVEIMLTIGGSILLFIYIVLFSFLSSQVQILTPTRWLPYSYFRVLTFWLLDALGYGISGFLMAIVVNYISRKIRIIAIIVADLIVTIVCLIFFFEAIPPGITWSFQNPFQIIIEFSLFFDLALLWLCSLSGAWLIAHKRGKKKLSSQTRVEQIRVKQIVDGGQTTVLS
jgi:hypothetical protein